MFSTQSDIPPFVLNYDIVSLFATELEEPKIDISGKGLSNIESGVNFFKVLTEHWKLLMCHRLV